jgi:hypothetical protein
VPRLWRFQNKSLMRKVLIVSPHFPPINAPDHQRVRMALPFFEEYGWRATVLAVGTQYVEGVKDPFLTQTLPENVRVVFTKAWSWKWMRYLGVGSLGYRAQGHLREAGDRLLRSEQFDLIFFSTTVFPVMSLGPRWQQDFGVPYVLDFQDPWVSGYYDNHPEQPPGGRLKYGFSQWLARRLEPQAVRDAAHVVCVSPSYASTLGQRYPDVPSKRFTTLPFGAAESDFSALPKLNVKQSLFDPKDGRLHWVYIGRGGHDMRFAVRAFCQALRRYLESRPEMRQRLHVHFAGTDYAMKDRARKTIEPVARECGVEDMVSEQTDRLPYFEVLRCLCDADALLIPGSDDKGYTASKLYPYILARKPLLAVFHEASSVTAILRQTRAGTVVTFNDTQNLEAVSDEIYEKWFLRWPQPAPATDWNGFARYTARSMTRQLCELFDRAIEQRSGN